MAGSVGAELVAPGAAEVMGSPSSSLLFGAAAGMAGVGVLFEKAAPP